MLKWQETVTLQINKLESFSKIRERNRKLSLLLYVKSHHPQLKPNYPTYSPLTLNHNSPTLAYHRYRQLHVFVNKTLCNFAVEILCRSSVDEGFSPQVITLQFLPCLFVFLSRIRSNSMKLWFEHNPDSSDIKSLSFLKKKRKVVHKGDKKKR